MSEPHADPGRRRFMRLTVAGAITGVLGTSTVAGAAKPRLDPESDRARQLDYTHDAASSDNPAHEEGARCANCTHFHGGADTQWASCNIFPEHRVNANGWCTSWFSAG